MAGKAGVFLGRASNASFLFALQTVRNRRKDLSPRDRVTVVLENHMGGGMYRWVTERRGGVWTGTVAEDMGEERVFIQ